MATFLRYVCPASGQTHSFLCNDDSSGHRHRSPGCAVARAVRGGGGRERIATCQRQEVYLTCFSIRPLLTPHITPTSRRHDALPTRLDRPLSKPPRPNPPQTVSGQCLGNSCRWGVGPSRHPPDTPSSHTRHPLHSWSTLDPCRPLSTPTRPPPKRSQMASGGLRTRLGTDSVDMGTDPT